MPHLFLSKNIFLGLNFVKVSKLIIKQFGIRVHRPGFFEKQINAHVHLLESQNPRFI